MSKSKLSRPRMKVIDLSIIQKRRREAYTRSVPAAEDHGPIQSVSRISQEAQKLSPVKLKDRTVTKEEAETTTKLVEDIREIFRRTDASSLRTKSILYALSAEGKKPWAMFNKGNGIRARQLASLLKNRGIHSQDIRFTSGVAKGYRREWFIDMQKRKSK